MTGPPRACIRAHFGGCSDNGHAVQGRSRCRAHGGKAWSGIPPERQDEYASLEYRRNRKLVLEREPTCHWRYPGCTLTSTQADHLLPVARGGTNSLDNLVASCARCNARRGEREGKRTQAEKRGRSL